MAIPENKPGLPVTIRNMLWPFYGQVRPTLCRADGVPFAGQSSVEIKDNVVTVTFVIDGESVRFA